MSQPTSILASVAPTLLFLTSAFAQTPVRYEDQRFVPADPSAAALGHALTLVGDRAFVSHPGNQALLNGAGAIWELRRRPDGLEFVKIITAEPLVLQLAYKLDEFDGLLAATSILYGFPGTVVGRVYLYDTMDPAIPMVEILEPPVVLPASSAFGRAVTVVNRHTVAVGNFADTITGCCGTIFIYTESNGTWSVTQELRPVHTGTGQFAFAGASLASEGTTLVVGGLGNRIWIFERDATGLYSEVAEINDPVQSGDSAFGHTVAIEGDLIAVGDSRRNVQHAGLIGSVYLYRRFTGTWTFEARLIASDSYSIPGQLGPLTDRFGYRVDISNGRVVVGAERGRRIQPPEDSRPGSAYVFEKEGGAWIERYRLWNTGREFQAEFGSDVAIDGDTVIVGARGEFVGVTRRGSLSVYHLPFGDVICDGTPNSSGSPATLEITGERRVAFGHLDVGVFDAPAGAFGYVIASQSSGTTVMPGGSQGNLCLGGAISRFRSGAAAANVAGRMNFDLDMQAFPTPQSGLVMLQPGDRWYFQVWYRDANPGVTSNFSAAVGVTFR